MGKERKKSERGALEWEEIEIEGKEEKWKREID